MMKTKHAYLLAIVFLFSCSTGGSNNEDVIEKLNLLEQSVNELDSATRKLPENIAIIESRNVNDSSNNILKDPKLKNMSESEIDILYESISSVRKLPEHPLSGCEARAHVTYLEMDQRIKKSLFKVWMFSGSTVAPAMTGDIYYTTVSGLKVEWGYHVAVAYKDSIGNIMVIDLILSPEPMSLRDWINAFEVSGLGVVTFTDPEFYLFNKTTVAAVDPVNYPDGLRLGYMARNVLNGSFYKYEGDSLSNHVAAKNIALNFAIDDLLDDKPPNKCEWRTKVQDRDYMLNAVSSFSDDSDNPCYDIVNIYNESFDSLVKEGY